MAKHPGRKKLKLPSTSHLHLRKEAARSKIGGKIQAHPERSPLYTRGRVFDSGISHLFSDEHRWQRWLDVWAALAIAQAEFDMIPMEAAKRIVEYADIKLLDVDRIRSINDKKSHKIMGHLEVLSEAVGEPYGGMIHKGATAENIHKTGDTLVLRDASEIILGLIGDTFDALEVLALEGKDMVCAGRTHGQQGIPITFGFKVAGWIDELASHVKKFEQEGPDMFTAMMGGAVGNFESLGEKGPDVQARMAELLNLKPMDVPSRATSNEQLQYVFLLSSVASTYGKIAKELYTLMQTEVGEVCEPIPTETVGSSAMPQKRNPQLLDDCIALTEEIFGCVPLALRGTQHDHEANGANTTMTDEAVKNASILTGYLLTRMHIILSGLTLNEERMRDNLDLTGGLINAATVMEALTEKNGGNRENAHVLIYQAAQTAQSQEIPFKDVLLANPKITQHLNDDNLSQLLAPEAHLGLSVSMAETAAGKASFLAEKLKSFHL